MAAALGAGWTLVEEGLGGRITVHDDPLEGIHKNGRTYLQPCLESHWLVAAIVFADGILLKRAGAQRRRRRSRR
jgi:hypothetical protein